jgi:dTDP-4-amino-4,6-dideoxygalactose transaminase
MNQEHDILVTSPLLPDLNNLTVLLQDIWKRKWITNNGYYHKQLEQALADYLGVPYISLMANGTLALMVALKTLNITGEVITTPYTFCATTHSILWNNCIPVFADIDPCTGNINPEKIESLITEKTTAIMPVHVYGNPCDTEAIKVIAQKYNLKVIYDAAHAFAVKVHGRSLLLEGDISCLSFHATKTYNTVEGGAVICHSQEEKLRIDQIKDFGIVDESTITESGMNCKMDEIRAAYGLENLNSVGEAIKHRKAAAKTYQNILTDVNGIRLFKEQQNVTYNYSYFPILVDKKKYGMSRDELFDLLKQHHIFSRRYFWPLISNLAMYKMLPSASSERLPEANRMSEQVLCLPIHHLLTEDDQSRITEIIITKK